MIKSHLLILFCLLVSIELSFQQIIRKSIYRRQNVKLVLLAIPNENSSILDGFMGLPLEKFSNLTVLGSKRSAYSKKSTILSRGSVNRIDFQGDSDDSEEDSDSNRNKGTDVFTRNKKPVDTDMTAAKDVRSSSKLYSFSYSSKTHDGSFTTRKEKADKNGKITGFYMLMYPDGIKRRVEYVADKNGFRAKIKTDEFGVGYKNPADVQIERYSINKPIINKPIINKPKILKIQKTPKTPKTQKNGSDTKTQQNTKPKTDLRDLLGAARKANFGRSSLSTGSINKNDDEDYTS